jgi:aminoglycoside 2''-phosphotransferase
VSAPSLPEIERGLQEAFPDLAIAPIRALETGFGSVAVETADGIVFRIPRHAGVADGHARELRALPVLRERLPAPVPLPRWRIEPGEGPFPLGAIGYRRLEGDPLSPELADREPGAAPDLARFFAALHELPLGEAEALGLPAWLEVPESFRWSRDQVMPALRDRLTSREYRAVEQWWASLLADEEFQNFPPAVIHGDPWYGNVLVDRASGRLAGVIDWEGIAISDPAWDFAALLHLGDRFFSTVLEGYAAEQSVVDGSLEYRARALYELRELDGVRLALTLDDTAELDDAVAKVRRSAVLSF